MTQNGKALLDSICYTNLGIMVIFAGLLIISWSSKQYINFPLALVVIAAISSPVIIYGLKRFTRNRIHLKTDNKTTRKLAYAALALNISGFIFWGAAIFLGFTSTLYNYIIIVVLVGCGLELLAMKYYRDLSQAPTKISDQLGGIF
ncbi:MAG: hypothetical protein NWE93_13615 [Candidatus Bathyarchaeota archaeon]|nr:hypothetical protein [Candidatus Bathyarchaeota archaeon]